MERFGDFMAGKGFYIVLFLCVAAIGVSGYYLFSSLAGDGGTATVSGPAQVVVTPKPAPSLSPTPSVTPVKPTVPPAASPSPSPSASASESPSPAPSASPSPSPSPKPAALVYTWPVKGDIIDAYSPSRQRPDPTMDDWRVHDGIDISAEPGRQVLAAASGKVESVATHDLLGTILTIDHGNGVKSVYANLAELPTVSKGDQVSTGDVIGAVGATAKGESDIAPHLHFSMTKNGVSVDPATLLPQS